MRAHLLHIATAILTAGWLATASSAAEQAAAKPDGKAFATPEEAFSALMAAVEKNDLSAELAILGSAAKPIVESGDAAADQLSAQRFVESYRGKHVIQRPTDERAWLVTGADDWPFPIPLVKDASGWRFDTAAGQEEIIARRIGRNERFTIQACLAFIDAQREFWERNPDKAPLLHYARRFFSSEGKRDGLYFPTGEDEEESPLGAEFARARAAGYEKLGSGTNQPFLGYHYRILERQGTHARDGAYSYLAKEWMIGGVALVAYPATYDNSGVMTFIVNHDGVVFQKDLGPDTEKLAAKIESFDPDSSWTRVPDDDLAIDAQAAAER